MGGPRQSPVAFHLGAKLQGLGFHSIHISAGKRDLKGHPIGNFRPQFHSQPVQPFPDRAQHIFHIQFRHGLIQVVVKFVQKYRILQGTAIFIPPGHTPFSADDEGKIALNTVPPPPAKLFIQMISP